MGDLRIARLRKKYRVSHGDMGASARLDRLLATVMRDGLLDAALERAGVSATTDVCIRRVDLLLREANVPNERLAASWSVAIADAIAARLREGGPDVIWYTSRHQALADVSYRAAHGDFARAWAWRQLGIWRAGDFLSTAAAATEILRALIRESAAAVGVVSAVAKAGRLSPLLEAAPDVWMLLAKRVLVAAGVNDELVVAPDDAHSIDDSIVAPLVAQIGETSAVVRAVSSRRDVASEAIETLAIIALLDHEPAIARTERLRPAIARLTRMMSDAPQSTSPRSHVRSAESGATQARDCGAEAGPARRTESAQQSTATSVADERTAHHTHAGGLLFLLHLVRSLDIPAIVAAESSLATRSFRWVLHQLALAFADVTVDDPAALAFAGVPPTSAPPSRDEPLASESEQASLLALRHLLVAALRERLEAPANESDGAVLSRVTARRAEIVADPAWFEIRLSLSEVATEIRRAGLDLDLGWLPWLGAVVRFVYA